MGTTLVDTDSKWIEFHEHDLKFEGQKTREYDVRSKQTGTSLGFIKWYGPWRCYSFYPYPNCIFEKQCLTDIISFIDKLMFKRRVELQNKKQNG